MTRFIRITALLTLSSATFAQGVDFEPEVVLPYRPTVNAAVFGSQVAADGDLVVVGARQESLLASRSGAIAVFRRDSAGYQLEDVIGPSFCFDSGSLINCWFGGRLDLSDGTIVAQGAGPSVSTPNAFGLVHVLERSGGHWDTTQIIRPIPNPVNISSGFGSALSIDRNLLAIGASGYRDTPSSPVGAVFAYERRPAGWVKTQMLVAPPQTVNLEQGFGQSIDLEGDLLVIGEPLSGGRVHVFERLNGIWTLAQTLLRPGGADVTNAFGFPVAVDGRTQTIVVAERFAGGSFPGRAWIFERDVSTGVWTDVATFGPTETSGTSGVNTNFGGSIAIEGDTVLVGSSGQRVNGVRMGAVEIIRRGPNGWAKEARLAPPLPHFITPGLGTEVDLEDGRAIVGDENWGISSSFFPGRAYIWELSRGTEVCAAPNGGVTLNVLFDDGSDVDLTASVFGLPGRGIGFFVAGDPAGAVPFGTGALCVGSPRRISSPQAFGYEQSTLYASLQHPGPSAPTSTAFQFVYSRRDGTFPGGASSARVVD